MQKNKIGRGAIRTHNSHINQTRGVYPEATTQRRPEGTAAQAGTGYECFTIELRALGYLMGRWGIMRWI